MVKAGKPYQLQVSHILINVCTEFNYLLQVYVVPFKGGLYSKVQ
jgi:hypothetical protein